ncbi:MAG: DMT family transporter [Proteobacteria bacterium]|nr:DMT family transporter [Pseudomonadota bacterium]
MIKVQKASYIGILWFLLSLICSNTNDIAAKLLVGALPVWEVAYLRFFFGALSLLPFLLLNGRASFATPRIGIHIIRGSLLFAAITMWTYGVSVAPLISVTTLSFTVPIFTLLLAPIFLKEKVGRALWCATIAGFAGALLVLNPAAFDFNPYSFILLMASFMFASLDVINKKYVLKETMLSMLFYSALVTTILAAPLAATVWVTPDAAQLAVLVLLGIGSNGILYCLLQAFTLMSASSLAPVRYLELLFSALTGYFFFHEIPSWSVYTGGPLIVASTLFITYTQTQQAKRKQRT